MNDFIILVKNIFVTIPYTNLNYNILKLLHQEGFIESVHRLSNTFLSAKLKYKGRINPDNTILSEQDDNLVRLNA